MRHAPLALLLGLSLVGCDTDETIALKRFNHPEDQVVIQVTASEDLGEAVTLPLRSNTGAIMIGEAEISPGSGPVGTEHQVLVWIEPDYKDHVIRARIVSTGDRGEQTHNMVRDSAEPRLWELKLRSFGEVGEQREDRFTFELWRAAEAGEDADFEEEQE